MVGLCNLRPPFKSVATSIWRAPPHLESCGLHHPNRTEIQHFVVCVEELHVISLLVSTAWNWRDTNANGIPQWNAGIDRSVPMGRLLLWNGVTRRIGIDGSAEAIKDTIRSVFGLRSKRAFWLEDEEGIPRCCDRNMPLGTYSLHTDVGLTV